MRTWNTENCHVMEQNFNYSLHRLAIFTADAKRFLGYVTPATVEDFDHCVEDLDNGGCPVRDGWEDGQGNTCNLDGWDEEEDTP